MMGGPRDAGKSIAEQCDPGVGGKEEDIGLGEKEMFCASTSLMNLTVMME